MSGRLGKGEINIWDKGSFAVGKIWMEETARFRNR